VSYKTWLIRIRLVGDDLTQTVMWVSVFLNVSSLICILIYVLV
jgi:hypothetical protein